MQNVDGYEEVKNNILSAFERKRIASIALCKYYSALALETFRRYQRNNEYWDNRTNTAYNTVFSESIDKQNEIGFLLAHNVEYGVYLELANDRKHEAIWPIIRDLDKEFESDLRELWKDD